MSRFGLLDRDFIYIRKAAAKYPEVEAGILFGSRAMGNYKKGSDVDIALIGARVDHKTVLRLSDDLNEKYPLPYFFDIVNYKDIANEKLKEHIKSQGKRVF